MHPLATELSTEIRLLAQRALQHGLPPPAAREATARTWRPLVYMRYGELEAILRDLELRPGMKVVDFSGPQWLSLALAARHPGVDFTYTNIIDDELLQYVDIAKALGLANIRFERADLRALRFDDNHFDCALSVSVIEHVYPAEGGDLVALSEIRRTLKPGGKLLLTVPYKQQRNLVYVTGKVYERSAQERSFYAREYDQAQFDSLLAQSQFQRDAAWFVCERSGWLALDEIEWGPRRGRLLSRLLVKLRKVLERLNRRSLDATLANRYLRVDRSAQGRLVNVSIRLAKS